MSTAIGETQVGPSCRGPETNVPARRREGIQGGPGSPGCGYENGPARPPREPRMDPENALLGGLGLVLLRLLGRLGLLVHIAPLSGRGGPSPTPKLPVRAGRCHPVSDGGRRMSSADDQRDQVVARRTARAHLLVEIDAEARQQRRARPSRGSDRSRRTGNLVPLVVGDRHGVAPQHRWAASLSAGERQSRCTASVNSRRRPPWPESPRDRCVRAGRARRRSSGRR